MREPNNVDEQKAALRALVTVSKDGEVTLKLDGLELVANGEARLGSLPAARELALRLVGHEVGEMHAAAAATAADLLNAARVLAEEPTFGADGQSAAEKLVSAGAQTVWFMAGVTRHQTTAAAAATGGAPKPDPRPGNVAVQAKRPDLPRDTPSAQSRAATLDERLRRLDDARGADASRQALEAVVSLAESAQRDGLPQVGATAFASIVQRESELADPALRDAYQAAIRRLSLPQLLRDVTTLILRDARWRHDGKAILVRAGPEGADAVIEQLTKAQMADDRRLLFNILVEIRAAIPSLLLMLGDVRWYVVRNAAELLGEMKAVEAQGALIGLLRHRDERVRRAVVNALTALGTPGALAAVQRTVRDTNNAVEVRQEAAAALGRRRERTSVTTLVRALDAEDEQHVQLSILAALGKVATPDAVERLITASEPERGLFKKKPAEFRIAAVRALGDAKTPGAIAALRRRLEDKEPEIREAAEMALKRAMERSGPSLPPAKRRPAAGKR